VPQLPRETDATFRKCSARAKWQIFAALKKIGVLATKSQHALGQKHFDPGVRPCLQKFLWICCRDCFEHFATPAIIDWSPVVGIDQAVIPNLVSLINVGHAR